MIRRYSSRHQRLDHVFLRERLRDARRYLRIAGYFRSSLFELLNEDLALVPEIRIVCNSDLDPRDLAVARSAEQQSLALREKWQERPPELEGALAQQKYQRLHALLVQENLQVRVVSKNQMAFLHGKAGVIQGRDGRSTSFMGSVNETRQGWSEHYELLWEDDSSDAISWVTDEFEYLWSVGIPLPRAVIDEIERCSKRAEYSSVEACPTSEVPSAALAESPIYRRGECLMPWQRAFVTLFLEHRERHGKVRLLLADEVGVGKTLSLAASAIVGALLGDGPVLILCPATLTLQWQVELWDKLGVPSGVWTQHKTWLDALGRHIPSRGAEDVTRCPFQIGIVSTGLLVHGAQESRELLKHRFGTVVLDEAHRARRTGGFGERAGEPNNLLRFMNQIAGRSRHVLLGTATPIQAEAAELWDLLAILSQTADHVLGGPHSIWQNPERALDILTGRRLVTDEAEAWALLRNPLPTSDEGPLFDAVRTDLDLERDDLATSRPITDLSQFTREGLIDALGSNESGLSFFQRHNPVLRSTVLRKRVDLEDRGLLPRIAVDIYPREQDSHSFFDGQGLLTSTSLDSALATAEEFTNLLAARTRSAGFLRGLLLQRICSSLASGRSTAVKLLRGDQFPENDDPDARRALSSLTAPERACLVELLRELDATEEDPKFEAVHYFLSGPPNWLEHGCIVFSQYYDTARWVAEGLAAKLPDERIALYAGADRSALFIGSRHNKVERDSIKLAVRNREIRLVVATDAACEGLNLQTLGTLINVDLPWNPSRLEQRLGRIKRFGQTRQSVDMLNLVYHGTRDEQVYERLSERMRDRHDLFGSLPDTIEDDWISEIEQLDARLAEFTDQRDRTLNAFDFRYGETVEPDGTPWENCANVLSRRDVVERLSRAWRGK
jgi:superfamily II DNA or RNA helicase